jgi:hypothetical protein
LDDDDGVFHVWDAITGEKRYSQIGRYPKFTGRNTIVALHDTEFTKLLCLDAYSGNLIRTIPFSSPIRTSAPLKHHYFSSVTSHIVPSFVNETIFVGLKKEALVLGSKTNLLTGVKNRMSAHDTSWAFFLSLYRLFYLEVFEDSEDLASPLGSHSHQHMRADEEVFLNLRNPTQFATPEETVPFTCSDLCKSNCTRVLLFCCLCVGLLVGFTTLILLFFAAFPKKDRYSY